jgi:hypothetical protein
VAYGGAFPDVTGLPHSMLYRQVKAAEILDMRIPSLALPAAAVIGLSTVCASAQETRYLDDRSSPVSLVQSFYNAVNRKEYARAWSYYGDEKPATDLDAFAKGFENTAKVDVLIGNVASEGAAGSTFYYLPVSIAASDASGNQSVFAGCYTARLANPAIQGTPFVPLHLDKGSLKPSDASQEDALPQNCPDAPPPEQADAVLDQARTLFATAETECSPQPGQDDPATAGPEQYRVPFRYSSDSDDQPEREARIFRFLCNTAAYNETHVYYQYDEDNGLRQLQFASPDLDIRYEDDNSDEKVDSITTIGYVTDAELVNSSYDEASQSLTSHNKWRGVGDASDSGLWIFRNGRFSLIKYDVDASYDGEINPQPVLDFDTAP